MHAYGVIRNRLAPLGFCLALIVAFPVPRAANSAPLPSMRSYEVTAPTLIEWTRARAGHVRGRTVARGPRGGVAVHGPRGTVMRGPRGHVAGVRHGVHRPVAVAPGWRRPAGYWWRPGGAVAGGAAVGFLSAAAAPSYVGSPPAADYCWYYTNPQRTQGFWDV